MKLCWDNIENVKLTINGNFRDVIKNATLYLKICKNCNDNFFAYKQKDRYCSKSCSKRGKHNSFYGKHHKKETKEKVSKLIKGMFSGEKNPMYGKKGKESANWKGGYGSKNIPRYDIYAKQLEWCEKVRSNKKDRNILEVKCFKCGEWYIPTRNDVVSRIQHLKGNKNYPSENRFYCSNKCKNSCSIYNKNINVIIKENAIRAGQLSWLELTREVQPQLRQLVLEHDNNQCIKCGNKENLQCHHILPVNIEPLLSADIDNCITLCYTCHKEVHKKDGCRYGQLHIKICK